MPEWPCPTRVTLLCWLGQHSGDDHAQPRRLAPMTPERLAEVLRDLGALGLSQRRLAALWGYRSPSTVLQWLDGKVRVPERVEVWLEDLHAWWREHPPDAT